MVRKLKVDLADLEIALDTASYEMHFYLDLETGQVIMIMEEFEATLEEIYDEICDDTGNRTVSLEDHLQQRDDPDWQKEMLLIADQVEQGYGKRYIRIERDDPYDDYSNMERFIATVEDTDLQERLWRAIQGRGAFRRFKDLVARYPDLQDDWYEFKDAQSQQRLHRWLEARDIEPSH